MDLERSRRERTTKKQSFSNGQNLFLRAVEPPVRLKVLRKSLFFHVGVYVVRMQKKNKKPKIKTLATASRNPNVTRVCRCRHHHAGG